MNFRLEFCQNIPEIQAIIQYNILCHLLKNPFNWVLLMQTVLCMAIAGNELFEVQKKLEMSGSEWNETSNTTTISDFFLRLPVRVRSHWIYEHNINLFCRAFGYNSPTMWPSENNNNNAAANTPCCLWCWNAAFVGFAVFKNPLPAKDLPLAIWIIGQHSIVGDVIVIVVIVRSHDYMLVAICDECVCVCVCMTMPKLMRYFKYPHVEVYLCECGIHNENLKGKRVRIHTHTLRYASKNIHKSVHFTLQLFAYVCICVSVCWIGDGNFSLAWCPTEWLRNEIARIIDVLFSEIKVKTKISCVRN